MLVVAIKYHETSGNADFCSNDGVILTSVYVYRLLLLMSVGHL